MKLFHTSPTEITSIEKNGRFGEFLFFSGNVYAMTAGEAVTYSIDLDNEAVIDAGRLFYHEDAEKLNDLVAELAAHLEIDADTAEDLISEKANVYDLDSIDPEDIADASWDVQRFTARAAKILGFRGVAVSDEQGAAYMIDMLTHESDLVKA
ncbi:hypothetical protein PSCICO_03910 [Pseudomonas cichorii]|uniref:hypothetical protein n=1 Tax=Pseudomonas cichorii TaxID=36746 RepID=UPI00190FDF47|nr:hypothetical protein [Pseudomonas cichorii]GFM84992.1 hypothetical protein PSCICO_03910 [Pseudomonas cichorii]